MSPTFAMIEVSNANGLVLSMQRGQKLVSYNQSISRSGDAKQQLLIHGGASYAFSDVLKLDAKSKDNARSQASREISPMIAVFMAMEEAKELRNSIPEDLLGTAIKTLYSAQASLDDFVAPSEIQTKMPGYCIIPAQTMGAVAAAINYNLGPTGSLTCASACSGFAACVSFGVMMVNPSCWAMAAGCAGCTSSGLQSVLDECSREFMYFIRK